MLLLLGVWLGGFLVSCLWQINDNREMAGNYTTPFEVIWTSATWPLFITWLVVSWIKDR